MQDTLSFMKCSKMLRRPKGNTMKHFTLAAALLSAVAIAPAANAQSLNQFLDDIEVESTIDTVSEYVFRGISAGGSSIQPGTEFSVYGFSAGTTYTAGFSENSAVQPDVLDLFVGYQLPFEGPFQVDIGGTAYIFPQGNGLLDGSGGTVATYEVDATVGLKDVFLSPSIFAAYDFTLDNFTIEGNISHTFDLPREGWSLDARLNVGHVEVDEQRLVTTIGDFDNYQYGTATLAANKVITDDISFYVSGNFTANTEDDTLNYDVDDFATNFRDSDTVFWLGTGLTVNY